MCEVFGVSGVKFPHAGRASDGRHLASRRRCRPQAGVHVQTGHGNSDTEIQASLKIRKPNYHVISVVSLNEITGDQLFG